MADETLEFDNTAFVVYVPKMGGDPTVESCIRLGAGPSASNMSTADENTTYNDAIAQSQTLSGLSYETYNPKSGIALLTPGTINLVAAGGVNVTSASTFTNSTTGSTYTITQDKDSKHVISASYTSNDDGAWGTSSFNQAVTVAVNTVPLQSSIGIGAAYSVWGPISFSNNWGAVWSSTAGWSVNAQLSRNVAIGLRTVVVTDADGSTNQYYSPEQGSSTGQKFKWVVPLAGKYAWFDKMQSAWCITTNAVSLTASVVATVYAAVGVQKANHGTPSDVQAWLKYGEKISIACTILDAVCWAGGIVLGFLADRQADDKYPDNWGATNVTIGDGTFLVSTSDRTNDPASNDPAAGPTIYLDRTLGLTTLGDKKKSLSMDDEHGIVLSLGADVKVTLDKTSVKLTAKGHSITVANDGIAIAGDKVTIDTKTFENHSLDAKFDSIQKQLDEANQKAATAEHDAVSAQIQAALLRLQLAKKK